MSDQTYKNGKPKTKNRLAMESMSLSALPDYNFMGVYYIQNLINGKMYIGSSVNVTRRIKDHIYALTTGTHVNIHLQRSFNNRGIENFGWGVCEEVSEVGDLLPTEQMWMNEFGDYNILKFAGNTLGYKATPETRAKLSASRTGEKNAMYGRKRPEVGAMMKALLTGKKLSEEHKLKMSIALKGSKGVWAYPEKAAEVARKISESKKGSRLSQETKDRISAAGMGRVVSDETREKLREASTGRSHTEDTKKMLSEMKMGVPLQLSDEERASRAKRASTIRQRMSPEKKAEVAEKVAATRRGVSLSDAHKAKLSAATKGRPLTESHRLAVLSALASRGPRDHETAKAAAEKTRRTKAAKTPEEKEATRLRQSEAARIRNAARTPEQRAETTRKQSETIKRTLSLRKKVKAV